MGVGGLAHDAEEWLPIFGQEPSQENTSHDIGIGSY